MRRWAWLGVALACGAGCGGTSEVSGGSGRPPAEPDGAGDAVASALPPPSAAPTGAPSAVSGSAGPLVPDGVPPGPLARADLPRYDIDQAIDDVAGTFAGKVRVSFRNPGTTPLARLPFLLHPNAFAELGGAPGGAGSIAVTAAHTPAGAALAWQSERPTLVSVALEPPVAPGERAELVLTYTGRLRVLPPSSNDMFEQAFASLGSFTGAGASDYGLLAMGDGLVTLSSAFPTVAPHRDGAFDTHPPARLGDLAYNGVASFHVRTAVPSGVDLVTNLVDGAPVTLGDGNVAFVSDGDLVRDLVLVAGRDLARSSAMVGQTRVTSIYRTRDARGGKEALDAAAAALASFEKRFGPYPYSELDVAEATLVGGAGGVEFSSMVLIAGMLYRSPDESQSQLAGLMKLWSGLSGGLGGLGGPSPAPAPSAAPPAVTGSPADLLDGMLEFTVAHEVAHQYFAGIVGNDSYRFPSLDEPAAQYAAALAIEDRHGAAAAARAADANVKMNYALYRLLGGPDRPVLRDTASFRTGVEYAALVYGKAPYLYFTLRQKLGEPRLAEAMRRAVERYRFQVVSTEQWTAALEEAAGGPSSGVRATFQRYLEQTHGDQDLGVDESGDFVLATLFPPEMVSTLKQAMASLGMKPGALLRMLFGGSLRDDAKVGPGLDPSQALKQLGGLGGP
ncbi:MAG: hypothetical protein IT373_17315 [Polyangiaceae bacterium]|nr:hypothetical protein [Polyangiaceae bacterium]